jgi:hypothetical protein
MDGTSIHLAAGTLLLAICATGAAQTPQPAGTLVIAGGTDQAMLVRVNGKSYVDIESLARITHGAVRFQGNQVILTLFAGAGGSNVPVAASKPAGLSGGFLSAEIEALTQIREWRAALANGIQNNYPVTANWVDPLRRSADAKVQLAVAVASTEPDQKAVELLRNEFTNMQQLSDQFLAMHTKVNYIAPDSFDNNSLDQKVLGCERALAAMAATKEFEDAASCH